MNTKDKLKNYFGKKIRKCFFKCSEEMLESTEEIRLRLDRPVIFKLHKGEKYLCEEGLTENIKKAVCADREDLRQVLELMSDYSVYSMEEELKSGFITLKGGFRVGITGRCICENSSIKAIKYINGINIRICREVKGCADKAVRLIERRRIKNILIISPPNCGKTTFLRDIIRQLSDRGYEMGVVDERSEIGGCYMGEIQNDIGIRTDILDRCPKREGIFMLLRSMAPKYIAADEITYKEAEALGEAVGSGSGIICTAHAEGIDDIKNKKSFDEIRKKELFELYIALGRRSVPGEIIGMYDKELKEVEYDY